jgi:hypothetical protein
MISNKLKKNIIIIITMPIWLNKFYTNEHWSSFKNTKIKDNKKWQWGKKRVLFQIIINTVLLAILLMWMEYLSQPYFFHWNIIPQNVLSSVLLADIFLLIQ